MRFLDQQHRDAVVDAIDDLAITGDQRLAQRVGLRACRRFGGRRRGDGRLSASQAAALPAGASGWRVAGQTRMSSSLRSMAGRCGGQAGRIRLCPRDRTMPVRTDRAAAGRRHRHGLALRLGDDAARRREARRARRRRTRCAWSRRTARPTCCSNTPPRARVAGLRAIIAGAGGAAHLPGMLAAKTALPVLGVPVQCKALNGMDSLLSIVQMPAGIPVATFAIGIAGATNAALFAAAILAADACRRSPRRSRRSARSRPRRSRTTTIRAAVRRRVTTVGILGGGQLARMLALAGAPLGLRFLVLDTSPDACAGQFAPMLRRRLPRRSRRSPSSLRASTWPPSTSRTCRPSRAQWLAERVAGVPQPARAGDRAGPAGREDAVPRAGHPDAARSPPSTRARRWTRPSPRSARRASSRRAAWATTARASSASATRGRRRRRVGGAGRAGATVGLILEGFVPFERELSVVAVRGRDGEFRTWPLTENWHVDGMLSASLAPARVDAALRRRARSTMRAQLAEALDYVGVFALELFCRGRRAARPTKWRRACTTPATGRIEGSETSQFENHLRAVLGLPLGDTRHAGRTPACSTGSARCPTPRAVLARARWPLARLRQAAARGPQGRPRHAARRQR